jgi:hypothetical protein
MAQVAEHLLSRYEALSSNPITTTPPKKIHIPFPSKKIHMSYVAELVWKNKVIGMVILNPHWLM